MLLEIKKGIFEKRLSFEKALSILQSKAPKRKGCQKMAKKCHVLFKRRLIPASVTSKIHSNS